MKVVAISQRVDFYPDRSEERDALDSRLSVWVAAAGFIPVSVPNSLLGMKMNVLESWMDAVGPQAIILSGGNDIGQVPQRDSTEKFLLNCALSSQMPVLGLCRGMQMLNTYGGGTLKSVEGHVGTRHHLDGDFNGRIVNSFHGYSIDSLSDSYFVTARSEDGEIEAIRHRDLPWEGWMWHPEREADFLSAIDVKQFSFLVNNGK